MMANQMSARQPMLRDQMPDMDPTPPYGALPIATPTPRNPLEEAARFRGLIPPNPYARGLRPPTDAERERFDATNPEMPLNDLARARLEAERLARLEAERLSGAPINPLPPGFGDRTPSPINPFPPGFDVRPPFTPVLPPDYGRFPTPTPPSPPDYRIRPTPDASPEYNIYNKEKYAQAKAAWFANPRNEGRTWKEEYAFNDPGEPMDRFIYSLPPIGGEVAADPEPEEYDGFVDSGTGQRGFMGDKYMPTPMDTSVTMAQAAPVTMAQAAPVAMASTAYNAPPVASTAYMPPPTDAPVNTAYNAPPVANTAYMPSRRTVPVDTTYRPPASANTTYMPSSAPTYGMSSTPSYGMSNAQTTTPTYGGQIREPSFSPNQAGKYKVDGPRLKNTGGLFNDLNAFFGRPQT